MRALPAQAHVSPGLQHEFTAGAVTEGADHIAHIGALVEDAEIKMRSALNDIYFGKTKVCMLWRVTII